MNRKPSSKKTPQNNPPKLAYQIEHFSRCHFWLLLSAILLIALLFRTADLRADPPPDLSWSFAPYTDESLNTYSARNLILYGNWYQDDFLPFCIYPLVNIVVALIFKLVGIGFVQVKLLSVLSGLLGVLIMALLIRHTAGEITALLAGLLLALSYPLVMYSRLGLVETVQILFLLLTGFFWIKSLEKPVLMLLTGFCAFSTFLLIKISGVFILPALLLLFICRWLSTRSRQEERRQFLVSIGWFTAGAIGAIIVWLIVVFLPYRNQYLQYVLRHSSESPAGHPQTLIAYLFNTFTIGVRSKLLPRLVWIALLGFFVPARTRHPTSRCKGTTVLAIPPLLVYLCRSDARLYELPTTPLRNYHSAAADCRRCQYSEPMAYPETKFFPAFDWKGKSARSLSGREKESTRQKFASFL